MLATGGVSPNRQASSVGLTGMASSAAYRHLQHRVCGTHHQGVQRVAEHLAALVGDGHHAVQVPADAADGDLRLGVPCLRTWAVQR